MASEHERRDGWVRRRGRAVALAAAPDLPWLGATLSAGAVVYLIYLLTHQYPAYGAGLYLKSAGAIAANGYALPARIPHYTDAGVPFAYPPLMLYVASAITDVTPIGPVAYSLYVPGLLVLGYLVPYYVVAKELLGSARLAGLSGVLFAVTPAVLQWHLSAGGIVRAGALLFALAGAYTGIRLFRSGERRWVLPSAVLFGLTVLTHPTYTAFFGLTYLLLFARFGRTPRGLLHGGLVAGGGIALAAPWWIQVVGVHGVDVFTAAAGTHSGLGGGSGRIASEFLFPLKPNLEMVFYLGAYPGAAYAALRRRWFLPAWLVVPGYVIGKPRFQFVAGSMLTALLVASVSTSGARRDGGTGLGSVVDLVSGRQLAGNSLVDRHLGRLLPRRHGLGRFLLVGLVVTAGLAVGSAFAASELDTHLGSTTQPAFIDEADREAMAWAARNTDPGAEFVVLGDAAEWFPLFADRTSLIGPWGVEWTTPERYQFQLALYTDISDCDTAACLTDRLHTAEVSPDYVYVPRGHYAVRGLDRRQSDRMRPSLVGSDRYSIAYENGGVLVVGVDEPNSTESSDVRRAPVRRGRETG